MLKAKTVTLILIEKKNHDERPIYALCTTDGQVIINSSEEFSCFRDDIYRELMKNK